MGSLKVNRLSILVIAAQGAGVLIAMARLCVDDRGIRPNGRLAFNTRPTLSYNTPSLLVINLSREAGKRKHFWGSAVSSCS